MSQAAQQVSLATSPNILPAAVNAPLRLAVSASVAEFPLRDLAGFPNSFLDIWYPGLYLLLVASDPTLTIGWALDIPAPGRTIDITATTRAAGTRCAIFRGLDSCTVQDVLTTSLWLQTASGNGFVVVRAWSSL